MISLQAVVHGLVEVAVPRGCCRDLCAPGRCA